MLASDGAPKLVDFGIAKYVESHGMHHTLAHFRSAPYSPREYGGGPYEGTRDVHAFAVVCLECLKGEELQQDPVFSDEIASLELPSEVASILDRSTRANPAERPSNVEELFDELEPLRVGANRIGVSVPTIHLAFTPKAESDLLLASMASSNKEALAYLRDDLEEAVAIDQWTHKAESGLEATEHLCLLSATLRMQVMRDKDKSNVLRVIRIFQSLPSEIERSRSGAWQVKYRYSFEEPKGSVQAKEALDSLHRGLEEFLLIRKYKEKEYAENWLFSKWRNLLRLSVDANKREEDPIAFTSSEVQGNRISFGVDREFESDITEQPRILEIAPGNYLVGQVEYADSSEVVSYVRNPPPNLSLPNAGELILDTRKAREGIRRQQSALDAVVYGRSVRPDLRMLLRDLSSARIPSPRQPNFYFHDDLDESKKIAVSKALGAEDFLIVEGPPGTGKTTFIAETIAQIHSDNPNAKILLVSQTHNAIDNALEKLRAISSEKLPALRMTRIGDRLDPRIAPSVQDLLLENQVSKWLDVVQEASRRFIETWSEKHGVNREDVEKSLLVSRLRISKDKERVAEEVAVQARERVEDLKKAIEEDRDTQKGGETRYQRDEAKRLAEQDAAAAEEDLKAAVAERKQVVKKLEIFGAEGVELAKLAQEDLVEWEVVLLGDADESSQYRRLIELSEEWTERFGRSQDFHGAFIAESHVVAGTCVGAIKKSMQDIEFDWCIVDEASKATPTEVLVPLARSRRWILVGDPNQLPPFVASLPAGMDPKDYDLAESDLKSSILDHFLGGLPAESAIFLAEQHRMDKPIADMISQCFYKGRLNSREKRLTHVDAALAMPRPVTWFSTSSRNDSRESSGARGTSFSNLAEVDAIESFLKRLNFCLAKSRERFEVALLSGYDAQKKVLERMVAPHLGDWASLSVSVETVHAYQGREADFAIYSVTRSNVDRRIGFLRERQHLNVALSRGRFGLSIFGDLEFCRSAKGDNPFPAIIEYIEAHPADCTVKEV